MRRGRECQFNGSESALRACFARVPLLARAAPASADPLGAACGGAASAPAVKRGVTSPQRVPDAGAPRRRAGRAVGGGWARRRFRAQFSGGRLVAVPRHPRLPAAAPSRARARAVRGAAARSRPSSAPHRGALGAHAAGDRAAERSELEPHLAQPQLALGRARAQRRRRVDQPRPLRLARPRNLPRLAVPSAPGRAPGPSVKTNRELSADEIGREWKRK
jgi:hypothetical protein